MDDLNPLEFVDGEVTVDQMPNGDVYITVQSHVGGACDLVLSQAEAIELMQVVMEAIKYNADARRYDD